MNATSNSLWRHRTFQQLFWAHALSLVGSGLSSLQLWQWLQKDESNRADGRPSTRRRGSSPRKPGKGRRCLHLIGIKP